MVEQIANIVRVFPAERVRDGQPSVAMELICGRRDPQGGMYWSINLRCLPDMVRALDAAISAAYPDVRVGHQHDDKPRSAPRRAARTGVRDAVSQGAQLRLPADGRLRRAGVPAAGADRPRPDRAGRTVDRPLCADPDPHFFEEYARRLYRRHENKLARQERWGLPEGGLLSTLNRSEMADAQRTQNRSLFWLEAVIAADTMQACKTVAAAVQSRRGENRLHRRWMVFRPGLYRRRFAQARGPLVPSARSLVSAAEVAHLLELPTARMKGVPVRRQMLPRIPAPADCQRCTHPTHGEHPRRRRPGADRATTPAGDPDAISGRTPPSTNGRPVGMRMKEHYQRRGPVSGVAGRERRGRLIPARPQIRGAVGRWPGQREDRARCSSFYRNAVDRPRGGADRDRPQVRVRHGVPAHHPARLRQAGLVPGPRAPRVRDEPVDGWSGIGRWRSRPRRSPTTSSPRCWTSTKTRSSNPRAGTCITR